MATRELWCIPGGANLSRCSAEHTELSQNWTTSLSSRPPPECTPTSTYEIHKTVSHHASQRSSGAILQAGVCQASVQRFVGASWPLRKGEQHADKRVSLEIRRPSAPSGQLLPPHQLGVGEHPAAAGDKLTRVTHVFSSGKGHWGREREQKANK